MDESIEGGAPEAIGSVEPFDGGEPSSEEHLAAVENAALEWRLAFDTLPIPVFVVDGDGRIGRLNRCAQQLVGRPFEEIIGHQLPPSGLLGSFASAAAAAGASAAPLTRTVHDPERGQTWEVEATPFGTPAERVVVAARDLTAMVELQASLRRSEALAATGVVVAGVAHEVRNPLFGISAAIDALEARFGDRDEYARYVQALREQIDRLVRLMNDLIAYGRPTALQLLPDTFPGVVAEALRTVRPSAEKAGVHLAIDVDTDVPRVPMDQARLLTAVENLLQNAVQHSPPGGTVGLRLAPDGADWVELTVRDSGPGFGADDLSRIFEPFYSSRGGTGLGLPIVQRVADEHRGELEVGNHPEGGAVVRLRLPTQTR